MSHVYQPVMLMTLLQSGGKASTTKIAKAILDHDESQIEYYEKIVGNMVGRVATCRFSSGNSALARHTLCT